MSGRKPTSPAGRGGRRGISALRPARTAALVQQLNQDMPIVGCKEGLTEAQGEGFSAPAVATGYIGLCKLNQC